MNPLAPGARATVNAVPSRSLSLANTPVALDVNVRFFTAKNVSVDVSGASFTGATVIVTVATALFSVTSGAASAESTISTIS